ncbi:MAG: EboA domain-containing protein [Saonia sp.]
MRIENVGHHLETIVKSNVDRETMDWLQEKIKTVITEESTKDLYLTYSLIAAKTSKERNLNISLDNADLELYLKDQDATVQELSRIYLLIQVLEANHSFFTSKVANIIQVADTGELETFLKFLVLLPNAQDYKSTAVEALRTNIATIFDAIALKNPYPALFFNDQQWNQMYLKAAFMQRDLNEIVDVDKRANSDLARIISDYAHERWAASRDIDPFFWRPVSQFLDTTLLKDMERLLKSSDLRENKAAALCCYHSDKEEAKALIIAYPKLLEQIENKQLSWNTLKK